jgi:hypothetical protein
MNELIHQPAHERIVEGGATGEGLLALFSALAQESEDFGTEAQQIAMPYFADGDDFVPGTYVPELWLVVRKVLPDGNAKEDQGSE